MKTIGLIGGLSWESTIEYYRILNQTVQRQLGGLHSARILMNSVDFDQYRQLMMAGDWETIGSMLGEVAAGLEKCGADMVLIGTNTMHLVAPQVEAAISVPLLHIADATAEALKPLEATKVGLLGTKFTMERDFYTARLADHGIEAFVPEAVDREMVDTVIFNELCKGVFSEGSRYEFVRVINGLMDKGATAVVLGCTEIGLLVRPDDASVPLLDTCRIHAEAAVERALDLL